MEPSLTERMQRFRYLALAVLCAPALLYFAYKWPVYFTSRTYLLGLLLIEFLVLALWLYRRVFFVLIILAFLLAGVDLPVGTFWTVGRWVFLGVGAAAGSFLMLRERSRHFGLFHLLAVFAPLLAMVSAAVSPYPRVALLKALSFALLFLYGATGARISAAGRENEFFAGLLTGCELFVGIIAVLYFAGIEAMGNPNSLGAVMGIVAAPILLWGTMLEETPLVRSRHIVLYGICIFLTFYSHARAAMAAALVSSALLCIALRKYRMMAKGAGAMMILISLFGVLQPEAVSDMFSNLTGSIIYKSNRDTTLLASRESPWRAAVDSINNHLWFGTGLGTAETFKGPRANAAVFSSSADVTNENGSSYLTILSGVGILGVVPFAMLLLLLLNKVVRTVGWLRKTTNACHPAVPLAMVLVAALIHAGFEDWLFASGSYLCVWFWSLAFIFIDVAPSPLAKGGFAWRLRPMQRDLGGVASTQ